MSATIRLRRATQKDLQLVQGLLKSNNLCYEDIPQKVSSLFIGHLRDQVMGIGGVETYGRYGLLRSVVVEEEYRGEGYGSALVELIMKNAKKNGVKDLYLLTTTAEGFFAKMGFEKIKRDEVPSQIQNTTEFKELCPKSSICMRKSIA
jgi:amino-acid N-acetyltransferase